MLLGTIVQLLREPVTRLPSVYCAGARYVAD
jgi:hypothetical protein